MQIEDGRDLTGRVRRLLRGRPGYVVLACTILVLALTALAGGVLLGTNEGVVVTRSDSGDATESSSADVPLGSVKNSATADEGVLVVDVSGAVNAPGVFELRPGDRVIDAIEAAGGLSDDADVASLNQALPVTDGQKILVPSKTDAGSAESTVGGATDADDATGTEETAQTLVNINTADADELDTLPGVGPSTAQAIIDDRTQNGPFKSVDDLMRVSGIGEKKLEKMRSSICV